MSVFLIADSFQKRVDEERLFSEVLRSKPTEPLGPSKDLMLNSGGFFLFKNIFLGNHRGER